MYKRKLRKFHWYDRIIYGVLELYCTWEFFFRSCLIIRNTYYIMASIRRELVIAVKYRVIDLIYHDDIDKEHELRK